MVMGLLGEAAGKNWLFNKDHLGYCSKDSELPSVPNVPSVFCVGNISLLSILSIHLYNYFISSASSSYFKD